MKKTDFLIIGQGLAGSMMAWHLVKAGKKVLVVDNGLPSASSVAAGLFNPVTGRRFVKSWLIDELLPYAETVYHDIEKETGAVFYHPMPISRFINGPEEKSVYERSIKEENKRYIEGFTVSGPDGQVATCEINGGGFVNTGLFIQSLRRWLQAGDQFRRDVFDFNDLSVNEGSVKWKDITADRIIFCEGYQAVHNQYFSNLPFNLAKGEILTLKIPGLSPEKILMAGVYLVPLGNDIFKLGATYEWEDLEPTPTEHGLKELLAKLKNITDFPFEIINHEAGVRPAVKQRRPFLGTHPVYQNIAILNGLGTKGVLLAPYFADILSNYLLTGEGIDAELDIRQYISSGDSATK